MLKYFIGLMARQKLNMYIFIENMMRWIHAGIISEVEGFVIFGLMCLVPKLPTN